MEPKAITLKRKGCLVLLTGRGQDTNWLTHTLQQLQLHQTTCVVIRPENYQWYPPPLGPKMQDAAVAGLVSARASIELALKRIQMGYGFSRDEIVLMGFSAGAVMALNVATQSDEPFSAVISMAGAILEPSQLPACKFPEMPIILQHNQDDSVFEWDERFVPMNDALVGKGYKVYQLTRSLGGHEIYYRDVVTLSRFLSDHLEYEEWDRPHRDEE